MLFRDVWLGLPGNAHGPVGGNFSSRTHFRLLSPFSQKQDFFCQSGYGSLDPSHTRFSGRRRSLSFLFPGQVLHCVFMSFSSWANGWTSVTKVRLMRSLAELYRFC